MQRTHWPWPNTLSVGSCSFVPYNGLRNGFWFVKTCHGKTPLPINPWIRFGVIWSYWKKPWQNKKCPSVHCDLWVGPFFFQIYKRETP